MANTYVLIASNTLGSSASQVQFSSIPQTYRDLVLRISARQGTGNASVWARINVLYNNDDSNSTDYSNTRLYTITGTSIVSDRVSSNVGSAMFLNGFSITGNERSVNG